MNKSRLEAFTDAIIAVAMTILVLELERPKTDSITGLLESIPQIGISLATFFILATYWVNHHNLFAKIHQIDKSVLWLNTWFLFIIVMVPFFSSWVSVYPNSFVPELSYAILLSVGNLMYFLLTKHLLKINGHMKISDTTIKKSVFTIILNLISIVLGIFITPAIMLISQVIVFLIWIDKND